MNNNQTAKKHNSIAILGAIGPPWGGVGIHIDRLTHRLSQERIPYKLYDRLGKKVPEKNIFPGKRNPFAYFVQLFTLKESVIHIHTNNLFAITYSVLILKSLNKKVLITIHNEKVIDEYSIQKKISQSMFQFAIKKTDHVICVNKKIKNWIDNIGKKNVGSSVIPAFVPPTAMELDSKLLGQNISEFINSHNPIIGTHGWFGYFIDGIDVYSFDMISLLVKKVCDLFPNAGFYTVVSGNYNLSHRNSIFDQINNSKLSKNWAIIEKTDFRAVSLFSKSDLFIRPTITDGDSLSIRECIFLGVPVIASDCVVRPDGCILFKNRNLEDLFDKTINTLIDINSEKIKLEKINKCDHTDKIIELYRQNLN